MAEALHPSPSRRPGTALPAGSGAVRIPLAALGLSLGISLNNVNVRLHRGRRALKRRLEEMCLTCPVHGFLDCRCDEAERIRQLHAGGRQGRS